MEHSNKKWNDLNIKEKISIISAIVAFSIGWGLSIAGFIIPPVGEVADSILWILGQALIYSASVFGIAAYFRAETVAMKQDMQRYFNRKERLLIEREKLRNNIDTGEIPNINEEEDE